MDRRHMFLGLAGVDSNSINGQSFLNQNDEDSFSITAIGFRMMLKSCIGSKTYLNDEEDNSSEIFNNDKTEIFEKLAAIITSCI